MEQLNRSISKLKPPTKIISTSSSSSAIATALAVAAAVGNENANTPNNNNNNSATTNSATIANGIASRSLNIPSSTLTAHAGAVTAGQKRKPEDTAFEKRTRNAPGQGVGHRSTPAVAATASTLSIRSHVPGTIAGAKSLAAQNRAAPELGAGAGSGAAGTARAPLGRVTAPRGAGPASTTSSTASRRPAPTASRPAKSSVAAVQARGRPVATPSTSRMQQLNAQKKQQPSPAQSVSSSTSDLKSEAAAEGNTASTELSSADILNTLAMSKKKKRPAWDTKGRLEDMEELTGTLHQLLHTSATNMTDLTSKLESSESKISELETFRMSLESKVAVKESENKDILQKMKHVEQDLQMTARQHEEEIRLLRSQHSMEMDQIRMTQARLQQETEMLESKLRTTNTQLDHQMQENTSLRSTISTQSSNCLALESDIRALKMKIEVLTG
ncbi:hypothetical protein BGZ98_001195 [Dissophora globulifera]|nr:hypothetical protein BGZ98_001195 [Dissophora globulifera]